MEVPAHLRIRMAKRNLSHAYLVVGENRRPLAEALAAAWVCTGETPPCGHCPGCRKAGLGIHPDIIRADPEGEGLKAEERAARLEALQTLPSLEKYRELYKGRELTDYDLANLWPRRDVDAFLSERGLEYHQIQKKLREAGDQITLRLLEIHNEDEREAWLEKTMEEEKRAKLLDLIGRIMSTVGTITDAAALYIGPEGDINGIIVGTEGKAKIQTIGAGGYNIQCFHFRTLIHEIK